MAKNFPVVCLGASAGGIDAYTRLLREIPAEASFAVVVVNHLRRQPTTLPEFLGKAASMHVQLITERAFEKSASWLIEKASEASLGKPADAEHKLRHRPDRCSLGIGGTATARCQNRRAATHHRYQSGPEWHLLSAPQWVSMALTAA